MEEPAIFSSLKEIGVLQLDEHGNIMGKNEAARLFEEYFDHLIELVLNDIRFFCLCGIPANIQVIKVHAIYYIFIQSKAEEYRLTEEVKSLNKIIDYSFDGMVIADGKGILIHHNPSYEKLTGLSSKDYVGRDLRELVKEGVMDVSASLKAIEENRHVTVIQNIKTGAQVLVSAVPVHNSRGEIEKVVSSVRDLTKLNSLENEVKELEEKHKLVNEELKTLKEQNDPKLSLIGYSTKMKEVISRALRISQVDSPVLINGESGVGKEKFVNLIHSESYRAAEPLIKINCGAIPGDLLESELFGYEPGAFTGASNKGKKGLLEAAHNGMVFLDEIGEMSLPLQVKLLRFLQDLEFTKVGGTRPIRVNTRIIAATNRDLEEMVKEGTFRKDLYYRLNIIPIYIPALRERKDDIIPLVLHFLRGFNHKYGLQRTFTKDALDMLENYDWPGNVRELENFVERITLMSMNEKMDVKDIREELNADITIGETENKEGTGMPLEISPLKEQISEFEKSLIEQALAMYPSIRSAASVLGIDPSTLFRKMQKYGIRNS